MFGHDDKHHDDEAQDGGQLPPDMSEEQQDRQDFHPQDSHQYHGGGHQGGGHHDGGDDGSQDGAGSDDGAWQHPDNNSDGDSQDNNSQGDKPEQISDIIPGRGDGSEPTMPVPPRDLSSDSDSDDGAKLPHELIDIKQQALGQLKPLMGQLDQAPEDRFRVLMMMIQASDDQNLIKQAYDAANSISDEKIKAQALVDLVNEINYFTQHPATEN